MHIDQQVIDLATGIQRRRDFTAHTTGFAAGAVVAGSLTLAGVRGGRLYAATLLTWATALSFQHFGHVLRGPVTADAVRAEAARRSRDPDRAHSTTWPAGRTAPEAPSRLMTKGHPEQPPPGRSATRQAEQDGSRLGVVLGPRSPGG